MTRWMMLALMFVACSWLRGERVIIETPFDQSDPTAPATLPAKWHKGAGTQPVVTEGKLEVVSEEGHRAIRILRERDLFQVYGQLPEMAEGWYRVTLTGRSRTRTPATLGIRPINAPHRYAWQTPLELTEVWETRTIDIRLNRKIGAGQALGFELNKEGELELERVKLSEMSRDELIAAMKERPQEVAPGRKNLSRFSRFPLGIQSGFSITRDLSDEFYSVEADADQVGPSGAASLRIEKKGGASPLMVWCGTVDIPRSDLKHVVSLWTKGAPCDLAMFGDGRTIASRQVPASAEWQRVELAFDPVFMGRAHQVFIATHGKVWSDGLQIEQAEKATEYEKACEVALTWPQSEASAARIQIADETGLARWQVTGAVAGASVLAHKFDVAGKQSPPMLLGGLKDSHGEGEIPFDSRLGSFRIEAWVVDASGNRISPYNEIVITRVPRPRHFTEDAPDSPFGIHMGSTHRQLLLSKAVGINWTRLHDAGGEYIQWFSLEPEKGKWAWRDADLKRYRDHKIKILGSLSTSPGWASSYGQPVNDYYSRWIQPEDNVAFANYATQVVSRYKGGVIDDWDIWNEPWLRFWSKYDTAKKDYYRSKTAGEDYAKLSQAAYEAAKKANPGAIVCGVNTTAGGRGGPWTAEVVKSDGDKWCDVYDYHHYANDLMGYPNDPAERNYESSFAAVKEGRGSIAKPIWMTEGNGTNTLIDRGLYNHSMAGMEKEDVLMVCDRMARYQTALLAAGVKKIFLYHMNMGGELRPGFDSFQTLVTDDGYAHPCAAAHAQVAWELEDTRFVKRIEIGEGVYVYLFEGKGRSVGVVTSGPHFRSIALPKVGVIKDLFGNVVKAEPRFEGQVMYIESERGAGDFAKQLLSPR